MSIKIHHGPPGSYKTSGAVMDDFIPAARAGRVIVTNVRGLDSVQRVRDALGDDSVPDTFELHYLPTSEHAESANNREALARWWHWLPHGAFLLLDEAQMIWPKTWGQKDLDALSFRGGLEAAHAVNRPYNWQTAFEMHRHYGWDMVLTTPNIDRLRPDVRQCAEGAYKHKNQAMIGLKGFYLEAFHMADDSGKSASDFLVLRNRKIKKEVWGLYDSTATGSHSDTIAGLSMLASPRVLLILGVLASCIIWFFSNGVPAVLGGGSSASASGAPSVAAPAPVRSDASSASQGSSVVVLPSAPTPPLDAHRTVRNYKSDIAGYLMGFDFRMIGRYGIKDKPAFLFEVMTNDGKRFLRDFELNALGIVVIYLSSCNVVLQFEESHKLVSCHHSSPPPSRADVGQAATGGVLSMLK